MAKQFMPFRELLVGNRFTMDVDGKEGQVVYIKLGRNIFAIEKLAGEELTPKAVCDKGVNKLVALISEPFGEGLE